MKNKTILILLFCFFCKSTLCQDTAILYFKNGYLILNNGMHYAAFTNDQDYDTVVYIGSNKYLYLKRSHFDSALITFGQLGVYQVNKKNYLLREGSWVVDGNIYSFENSVALGFPEEFSISMDSENIMKMLDVSKKRRALKKRKPIYNSK